MIPWPVEDITLEKLVTSLIEHWFWVIIDGRLQVSVSQEGGATVTLSAETIEAAIRNLNGADPQEKQQLLRKLQFGRAALTMDQLSPDFHTLLGSPTGSTPKWDQAEGKFSNPEDLIRARNAFHAGHMVGFDVPVRVKRTDGSADQSASFAVYIQKTEQISSPVEVFLRAGLCISGQKYLRESGIMAIVKTEDDELGCMLGDAENPAHTRWERSGKHFKGKYEYGPSILGYVQRSATHLCSMLSRRPEGLDHDLLQNLFFVPEAGGLNPPVPGPGPTPNPRVITRPPPREVFVECEKIENGFRLKPHPRATRKPAFIQIRAAYDVSRGNPFKFHHPADFDFSRPSNISLQMAGLTVVNADPKRLLLSVDDRQFELTATGFDGNRDLVVDVKPLPSLPATGADLVADDANEENEQ